MMKTLLEEIRKDIFEKLSKAISLQNSNSYRITQADLVKLYRVLNREVFQSKLPEKYPKISLKVEEFSPAKHVDNNGKFFVGRFEFISNETYNDFIKTENPLKNHFIPEILILDIRDFQFEKIVGAIVHEMIHLYDYLYGQGKLGMLVNILDRFYGNQQTYDTHGPYFTLMKRRIEKDTGIIADKKFKFSDAIPKKIEEQLSQIEESNTLNLNDCSDKYMVKLAKIYRAILKDDGTNVVSITDDGRLKVTIY